MAPGPKFSSSTSARLTMSNSRARPRSVFRFRVMARLLAFSIANDMVVLAPGGVRWRNGSPRGGSILITLAPALAIRTVA